MREAGAAENDAGGREGKDQKQKRAGLADGAGRWKGDGKRAASPVYVYSEWEIYIETEAGRLIASERERERDIERWRLVEILVTVRPCESVCVIVCMWCGGGQTEQGDGSGESVGVYYERYTGDGTADRFTASE